MSKKTKYFLDTEFIEDGSTIDLISIGLVCEDGRMLYRQNASCAFKRASDWVWRNVFPHLDHFNLKGEVSCSGLHKVDSLSNGREAYCSPDCKWRTKYEIRDEVKQLCDPEKYGKPEFWGYYADYDWVAFCQLFGTMMELPKGFPMYCRDVKQWADMLGNPNLPKPINDIHHALQDALNVQEMHTFLTNYKP